jgi:hypothetical protein
VAGAVALWAISTWWMIASLESPNEAQADAAASRAVASIEGEFVAMQSEIARLTTALDGVGDQVASLERERQMLAARVVELESGAVPDGTVASLPSESDGSTTLDELLLAGPEPDDDGLDLHVVDPWFTNGQNLYNCSDFDSWEQAQAAYEANLPGDPNYIDGDGNGRACEKLRR